MKALPIVRRQPASRISLLTFAFSILAVLGMSACQSMLAMTEAYDNKHIRKSLPPFEKYAKDAEILKVDQPSPAWQVQLPSLEVDDVMVVPQGFLVGTTDFGSVYGRPIYGPYMALDAQGKTLWTIPRQADRKNQYSVECLAPVFIYSRIDGAFREYSAADLTTGKPIWTIRYPVNTLIIVRSDVGALAIVQLEKEILKVSALDMISGKARWKTDVPGKVDPLDPPTTIQVTDGILIVARNLGIVTLDGEYKPLPADIGQVSKDSYTLLKPGAILVPDRQGYLDKVNINGQVEWRYKLNGTAASLTSDGDRIIVETKLAAPAGEITAIGPDGKKQWSFPVATGLKSPLFAAEDRVAFTVTEDGKRRLILLNQSTGSLAGRIDIPGREDKTLPDLFERYPGRLIVLQEEAVSSVRLGEPRLEWSFDLSSYVAFRYDKMQPKEIPKPTDPPKTASSSPADIKAPTPAPIQSSRSESVRLEMARASEAATFSRTNSTLTSSSSTRTQRSAARQERMAATEATIGALNSEAAAAKKQAWVSAAGGVGMALAPIAGQYVADYVNSVKDDIQKEDDIYRTSFRLNLSVLNYQRMSQRSWYVRPLSADKRNSVVLVDLKDGRWQEIYTEPSAVVHRYAIGTQIPTVSNDLLFVRGAGLNPKLWRTHETNSFHAVGADVMAFGLADIKFLPSDQFPSALRTINKDESPVSK